MQFCTITRSELYKSDLFFCKLLYNIEVMSRVEELLKRSDEYINSREVYMNYLTEYEKFSSSILRHTREILLDKNTTFNFERKGNSREGALTQKDTKLRIGGRAILTKVIKVRKDVDFSLQLHTYFHELAHLINDHNNQTLNEGVLSKPQKEYVAETVAQALLYSFAGGMHVSELPSNNKWDQSKYIEGWISKAKFSEEKIDLMWKQIEFAYEKVKDTIINKINKKTTD